MNNKGKYIKQEEKTKGEKQEDVQENNKVFEKLLDNTEIRNIQDMKNNKS